MHTRSATRLVLVTALVAVLVTLTAASPAGAKQYDCSLGYFCAWKDTAFEGSRFNATQDYNALNPYGFNDNISSAFNRNSATFSLHQHVDCDGLNQTFSSGVADSQVNRNDDASSINDWAQNACITN